MLDGPYADSEERRGGYYLIDVTDLDAALSWAAIGLERDPVVRRFLQRQLSAMPA